MLQVDKYTYVQYTAMGEDTMFMEYKPKKYLCYQLVLEDSRTDSSSRSVAFFLTLLHIYR